MLHFPFLHRFQLLVQCLPYPAYNPFLLFLQTGCGQFTFLIDHPQTGGNDEATGEEHGEEEEEHLSFDSGGDAAPETVDEAIVDGTADETIVDETDLSTEPADPGDTGEASDENAIDESADEGESTDEVSKPTDTDDSPDSAIEPEPETESTETSDEMI